MTMILLCNTSKQYLSPKMLAAKLGIACKLNPTKEVPLIYGGQVDKLSQYKFFQDNHINSVLFTESKEVVEDWLSMDYTALGRKLLTGKEGNGIVIIKPGDDIPDCKVYTQYMKKATEFRVHIFKDNLVSVLEKRKKKGWTGPTTSMIRNAANGYVFCRQDVVVPEGLVDLALRARKVTTSDFVGVDIGYNKYHNNLFVIEVNSAPGMENSTLDDYATVIKGI